MVLKHLQSDIRLCCVLVCSGHVNVFVDKMFGDFEDLETGEVHKAEESDSEGGEEGEGEDKKAEGADT